MKEEEVIEIVAEHYVADWVESRTHEIKLKEVWGIELHLRGDSWHIVLVTKQKMGDSYYTFDLGHWIYPQQVIKIFTEKRIKILKIVNYHSGDNFLGELQKVASLSVLSSFKSQLIEKIKEEISKCDSISDYDYAGASSRYVNAIQVEQNVLSIIEQLTKEE